MTERMDLTRFEDLALTHGPDPAGWPEAVRAEAEALLARSPEAQAARDRAAMLFDALEAEAAHPAPAPDALMARILADAAEAAPAAPAKAARAPVRRAAGFGRFWRLAPPAALAASALIGVALGYSAPDSYSAVLGIQTDETWTETASLIGDPGLFDDLGEGEEL